MTKELKEKELKELRGEDGQNANNKNASKENASSRSEGPEIEGTLDMEAAFDKSAVTTAHRNLTTAYQNKCLDLQGRKDQIKDHLQTRWFTDEHQTQSRKDDIPPEVAAVIMQSMVEVARQCAAVEISVRREFEPHPRFNLSKFVVTLPENFTQEQWAEVHYWVREVAGNVGYDGD